MADGASGTAVDAITTEGVATDRSETIRISVLNGRLPKVFKKRIPQSYLQNAGMARDVLAVFDCSINT
jgi:hypothetical protein